MNTLLNLFFNLFLSCPRERAGYLCHRYSAAYGYKCEDCGQQAKLKAA